MSPLHVLAVRIDHLVRDCSPHSLPDFGPLVEVGRFGRRTRSSYCLRDYQLPIRTPVRFPEYQDREGVNITGSTLPIVPLFALQAPRTFLNDRRDSRAFVFL